MDNEWVDYEKALILMQNCVTLQNYDYEKTFQEMSKINSNLPLSKSISFVF